MRTNTRVEFGLYDVTARGDSAPSCTTAKPFCNLGRDLLLESVPTFFPEVPEQYFWGLWSTTQSDKSGVFPDPPVLDITFTQDHSSSGLTLHFYSPTEDWASRIKIQWFSKTEDLSLRRFFTRTRSIITVPRK